MKYEVGAWYLAQKKDTDPKDINSWEIVMFTEKGFKKSGNLIPYPREHFEAVLMSSVLPYISGHKEEARELKKNLAIYKDICIKEVERKKAKKDNDVLIDELLKVVGTAVDNINGDLPLSGYDLETNNTKLVKIVTQLRDAGVYS